MNKYTLVVDTMFSWCVDILRLVASLLGITYEAVNVWVFCVIWPIFTSALIATVIGQHLQLKKVKDNEETSG